MRYFHNTEKPIDDMLQKDSADLKNFMTDFVSFKRVVKNYLDSFTLT